jgi:hypothetical protein
MKQSSLPDSLLSAGTENESRSEIKSKARGCSGYAGQAFIFFKTTSL